LVDHGVTVGLDIGAISVIGNGVEEARSAND